MEIISFHCLWFIMFLKENFSYIGLILNKAQSLLKISRVYTFSFTSSKQVSYRFAIIA